MYRCDWCNKPIRFWQKRFEGRLYSEHVRCHAERVTAHHEAWSALPEHIQAEERAGRWYGDLVADGMIPVHAIPLTDPPHGD